MLLAASDDGARLLVVLQAACPARGVRYRPGHVECVHILLRLQHTIQFAVGVVGGHDALHEIRSVPLRLQTNRTGVSRCIRSDHRLASPATPNGLSACVKCPEDQQTAFNNLRQQPATTTFLDNPHKPQQFSTTRKPKAQISPRRPDTTQNSRTRGIRRHSTCPSHLFSAHVPHAVQPIPQVVVVQRVTPKLQPLGPYPLENRGQQIGHKRRRPSRGPFSKKCRVIGLERLQHEGLPVPGVDGWHDLQAVANEVEHLAATGVTDGDVLRVFGHGRLHRKRERDREGEEVDVQDLPRDRYSGGAGPPPPETPPAPPAPDEVTTTKFGQPVLANFHNF